MSIEFMREMKKISIKQALDRLCEELLENKSYFYSWRRVISNCIIKEMRYQYENNEVFKNFGEIKLSELNKICENSSTEFLNGLIRGNYNHDEERFREVN